MFFNLEKVNIEKPATVGPQVTAESIFRGMERAESDQTDVIESHQVTIEIGDEPPLIFDHSIAALVEGSEAAVINDSEVTIESNIDSINEIRIDDNTITDIDINDYSFDNDIGDIYLTPIETSAPDVDIEAARIVSSDTHASTEQDHETPNEMPMKRKRSVTRHEKYLRDTKKHLIRESCDCRMKCHQNIDESRRGDIWNAYWSMDYDQRKKMAL